MKKKSLKIFNY